MMFISTRAKSAPVSFYEALFHGLATDGGLYVPQVIPHLAHDTIANIATQSLTTLGQTMMSQFLTEIPLTDLQTIIDNTLSFSIPLILLEDNIYLLEVFHGPTLAFKDIGARFMAQMMAYYLQREHQHVSILVATSGDTGSAIAHAFYGIQNVDVYVLYPSHKITFLQEQQMTTLGGNIHALEVEGTFDDCQKLVKQALADESLRINSFLTTANSINIARLLPQIIYHSWGVMQLKKQGIDTHPTLVVPSGNLGNLTAAVYAKAIGFSIHHFVAAVNSNKVFPEYIDSGQFSPQPSQQTYSNAMDVGNPSNIERLLQFYGDDHVRMRAEMSAISISDPETLSQIRSVYERTGYILDPHTAVGIAAARRMKSDEIPVIVTATAHPAKFPDVIKRAIQIDVEMPEVLRTAMNQPKQATKISIEYGVLKAILLNTEIK